MTASMTADMIAEHEALDELLLRHQDLLLDRNLRAAEIELQRYRNALLAHMRIEEEELFPVYAHAQIPPGGGLHLFEMEHAKIRDLLAEIETRLEAVMRDESSLSRKIVSLLELESTLKRVIEHHDLRERRFLYPAIDSFPLEPVPAEPGELAGETPFNLH